jgi:hypothetical protein
MGHSVFFSWQSDRPAKEGRNLIEQALSYAIGKVGDDLEMEEALREGLKLDKDTKGVPGSPPIFDTILGKIGNAAVFVADLTFAGIRASGDPTPNPNVLIEYGFALKALNYSRIITVMNEAYGEASKESMPFDLAHLRFPIRYNLPENAPDADRRKQRDELAKTFTYALKLIFESNEFKASLPALLGPPPFAAREPQEGRARFRAAGEPLGVSWDRLPRSKTVNIHLQSGPSMWLRVMPLNECSALWSQHELRQHAERGDMVLQPFIANDPRYMRARDGFGVYTMGGSAPGETGSVAFAFENGEMWAIDTLLLATDPDKLYFGEIAELLTARLEGFGTFLQRLGIEPPYRWVCGLEGVDRRTVAIPRPQNHVNILSDPLFLGDEIVIDGTYDLAQPATEPLHEFFALICRRCGVKFPDYPPFV